MVNIMEARDRGSLRCALQRRKGVWEPRPGEYSLWFLFRLPGGQGLELHEGVLDEREQEELLCFVECAQMASQRPSQAAEQSAILLSAMLRCLFLPLCGPRASLCTSLLRKHTRTHTCPHMPAPLQHHPR